MVEEEAAVVERRRWQRWLRRDSNPVLIKELRGRMRGARAFVVLTVYLLLLSCFASLIYYAYTASARASGSGMEMTYLGKVIFASVVLIEIFMVTFITPAFTSGAVSGERERKTYELLRTTLLPARKLLSGKLTSALSYMFLLILAAVPLESLAFMLGGVVWEELALALVVLLVSAFFFAVLGLFFSSFARTTLVSTVLTYATALLMTIGLPVLVMVFAALMDPFMYGYGSSAPPSWRAQAALIYLGLFVGSLSPISAAVITQIMLDQENAIFYYWQDLGVYSSTGYSVSHRVPIPSPWVVYTAIYVGLSLILLLAATLRVRRQARK